MPSPRAVAGLRTERADDSLLEHIQTDFHFFEYISRWYECSWVAPALYSYLSLNHPVELFQRSLLVEYIDSACVSDDL